MERSAIRGRPSMMLGAGHARLRYVDTINLRDDSLPTAKRLTPASAWPVTPSTAASMRERAGLGRDHFRGTRNEQLPQHFAIDRLLEDPRLRERTRARLPSVSGHEHERHVARLERLGHRIDHLAGEIDVEDGGIDGIALDRRERVAHGRERTEHVEIEIAERLHHCHGDQYFILDQ